MYFSDFFPLISSVFVFFIGMMVFLKNPKSRINFTFSLHALVIFLWLFGTFMMFMSRDNRESAIFWDRFIYAAVSFIPVFMYHFGLAYRSKNRDLLLIAGYILSPIFLVLSQTPYFVDDLFQYKWGVHTQARFFHHIFLAYFSAYTVIWFFQFFRFYKNIKSPYYREQTSYVLLGFLLLFAIGPLAYLPAYGIGIYPFAYFSGVIFTLILSYAIIRHRLMGIKFVLRKSSIFVSSIITLGLYAAAAKFTLFFYFHKSSLWADFFILVIGLLIYIKLKDYYYRIANKYFFTSLYDPGQVISSLSEELRTTIDIEKIYSIIHGILDDAMHVREFAILELDEKKSVYKLIFTKGFERSENYFFAAKSLIHSEYFRAGKSVVIPEMGDKVKSDETLKSFKTLKFEVLVPLNVKDKTIGIMAFGRKETGDSYSGDDIEFLEIIASQAAISIENALLYRKNLELNVKLEKEVQEATRELKDANKKLMKLDQAKSEFMSIASHQLRTPLTVIKGYTSMMLEKNFGEMNDKQIESLMKVYDSNERLIQLVENLLNISRIESGGQEYYFENVSLKNLLDGVVDELSGLAKKKNLEIIYETDGKLPNIKADEEKIRQVALNLIENALKYTNQGKIRVNLKRKAGEAIFSVSDKGVGITKKDMPKLFKKFSRGTSSSMSHIQGTGLGLYVAKSIVEAHKGKLWAESKGEGRGSTFYFTLPLIKKTYEEKNPHSRGRGILTRHVQDQVRKGGL